MIVDNKKLYGVCFQNKIKSNISKTQHFLCYNGRSRDYHKDGSESLLRVFPPNIVDRREYRVWLRATRNDDTYESNCPVVTESCEHERNPGLGTAETNGLL